MRILSGILGLTLSSVVALGTANAADLSGGYKDGPAYAGFDWTGAYIGAHVGGAWSSLAVTNLDNYTGASKFSNNANGVFGGGTIGYNLRAGSFILGVEGDLGSMNIGRTVVQPGSPGGDTKSNLGSGLYGDITARLGLPAGNALFYVKGGYAFYSGEASVFDNCNTYPCGLHLDQSNKSGTFDGWTAGGGVEYLVSPAWSIKGEYLHFDFGNQTVQFTGTGENWGNKLTVDTVKFGLNYHVGGHGYEPLK